MSTVSLLTGPNKIYFGLKSSCINQKTKFVWLDKTNLSIRSISSRTSNCSFDSTFALDQQIFSFFRQFDLAAIRRFVVFEAERGGTRSLHSYDKISLQRKFLRQIREKRVFTLVQEARHSDVLEEKIWKKSNFTRWVKRQNVENEMSKMITCRKTSLCEWKNGFRREAE